jgi:phytoene dehydrogenase-like protein
MPVQTANIIGSGPNGLAAAITLVQAGVQVTVYEAAARIGGACSSAELTLPGFVHDLGSSAYPLGFASPFFRSLPLEQYGLRWLHAPLPLAHPLDDGTAVALHPRLDAMLDELGFSDGEAWRRLFEPLVEAWPQLVPELLGPILHIPRHPLPLIRFAGPALTAATTLAHSRFNGARAQALFAGNAAHSVMPLENRLSSSFALVLAAAGHVGGWPVVAGGAQSLANALAAHLESLGGSIHTSHAVASLDELPAAGLTLFDTSAPALARIAGDRLSPTFRKTLNAFRPGAGAFKIDWALSEPIPWKAPSCAQATTIHVGGTLEEIAAAEAETFRSRHDDRPFVLLVQPSIADSSRAPAGRHTAWAYCHVPNGSTVDRTGAIEAQVERFAPGFRDCILARHTQNTAQLQSWNPNLLGGDLAGGGMTAAQLLLRPSIREYATSNPAIYLCSASTPPGGGVHGMAGFHAAKCALRGRRPLRDMS